VSLVVEEGAYEQVPSIGAEGRGLPVGGRHAALADGRESNGNGGGTNGGGDPPAAGSDSFWTPAPRSTVTALPPASLSQTADLDSGSLDSRVTTAELSAVGDAGDLGLPVRVRQASLAPQLREARKPEDSPPAREPRQASPEAARNTMAALQRGWELGRSSDGDLTPGVAPGAGAATEGGAATDGAGQ